MRTLLQACAVSLRRLASRKRTSVPAVVAFSLGIGAATAMFGVYYNILISPFPYKGSSRMATPIVNDLGNGKKRSHFAVPEVLEFERAAQSSDALLAFLQNNAIVEYGNTKDAVMGNEVSANTFAVLGVAPVMGRAPVVEDTQPGAEPVFVVSYKTWQKVMAADPAALGRKYLVAGKPRVLIGVMPPRFAWGAADIWQPIDLHSPERLKDRGLYTIVAVRKPGASESQVLADFANGAKQAAARVPKAYPERYQVEMTALVDQEVGEFRKTVYLLIAGAGLLLLIACSNVANLLLAQAIEDRRDFSLRAAMGASRFSLVMQFVLDGVLLALLGCLGGLAVSWVLLKILVSRLPEMTFPAEMDIGIGGPVFPIACGIALTVSVLASLLPAVHITGGNLAGDLAGGGRSTRGPGVGRLFDVLVLNQVILSLLLLAGSGLMLRSFLIETGVPLGARLDRILWTWTVLPPERYTNGAQRGDFVHRVVQKLRTSPGVVGAGAGQGGPPMGGIPVEYSISGSEARPFAGDLQLNGASYFEVLGIPLVAGRYYTEEDVVRQRQYAVINQTMARVHFRGENPLGRRIRLAGPRTSLNLPGQDPWFEVIGVAADVKNAGVREDVVPGAYLPPSFSLLNGFGVFIRTTGEPLAAIDRLRRDIREVDSGVMTQFTDSMEHWVDAFYFARPRFSLLLLSAFTGIGLLITSVGVYSVVAFGVASRLREVAIRKALGASSRHLVLALAGRTFLLVGAGVGAGYILTVVLGRFVESQFWGVSPYEPKVLLSAALATFLIGAAAALAPSWRASRAEPADVLRGESS
ncbi:hypothetical protein F183_A28300 [Bryobacterales bacterium F-183]|nr:hypothetical protein F183_A28300 [Bryobacterales bacterium F-183]